MQEAVEKQVVKKSKGNRIFISYKRNVEPDEMVAREVFDALKKDQDVFMDVEMAVGTRWAERIETEIREADFLIVFLSATSIQSEMILGEIETAHHLAKQREGRPTILPVRLDYREPFQYPLSAYLNQINWAFWSSPEDTSRLIQELSKAISGRDLPYEPTESDKGPLEPGKPPLLSQPLPAAQPAALELPEGTIDPESRFYIERSSDLIANAAIERQGVTIVIKGPRQMGKSSLLIRTMHAAAKTRKYAFLDFQLLDQERLKDADVFFRQFCFWLTDTLEIEDKTEEYWSAPLGNSQRCTRYVERHVLRQLGGPLLLAMDEVNSIFDTRFRTDFFSMLRSWHNLRATSAAWKQLDLALVTSTEPYEFIESLNQSPFNVGEVIDLEDFTEDQVGQVNARHESPFNKKEQEKLFKLLHGHPYLVRRALYLVATKRISVEDLFKQATEDRGPFGDHLRYYLFRLQGRTELIDGLRQVIRNNTLGDEQSFFRLRGAGLVRREGGKVMPRCELYENYFREHLNG